MGGVKTRASVLHSITPTERTNVEFSLPRVNFILSPNSALSLEESFFPMLQNYLEREIPPVVVTAVPKKTLITSKCCSCLVNPASKVLYDVLAAGRAGAKGVSMSLHVGIAKICGHRRCVDAASTQMANERGGISQREEAYWATQPGTESFMRRFNTCAVCGKFGHMTKCGKCARKRYCGIDCATKDWPEHKNDMCGKHPGIIKIANVPLKKQ